MTIVAERQALDKLVVLLFNTHRLEITGLTMEYAGEICHFQSGVPRIWKVYVYFNAESGVPEVVAVRYGCGEIEFTFGQACSKLEQAAEAFVRSELETSGIEFSSAGEDEPYIDEGDSVDGTI